MQSFIGDDSEDEDRMDHFDKPWTSVFKTFTMFIGELEFSDLPIDSSDSLAFFNFTFLQGRLPACHETPCKELWSIS